MKNRHNRLIAAGALPGQDRVKALPAWAEVPEGVGADGNAPIDSGDDPANVLTLWAKAECGLGEIWKAIVLEPCASIIEGLRRDAEGCKFGRKVILAYGAKIQWFESHLSRRRSR
jgi:hypothetical protein